MTNIATDTIVGDDNVEKSTASLNSIFIMADSGARGSAADQAACRYAWFDGETIG